MMTNKMLNVFIALVWLANGLLAKVCNLVPRHTQIVETILDVAIARPFTIAIGLAETALAFWILTGIQKRATGILQIILVIGMNITEFILVPHMLLWGRFNSIFALLFAGLIYYHTFIQKPRETTSSSHV
jgi:hypothetical protein